MNLFVVFLIIIFMLLYIRKDKNDNSMHTRESLQTSLDIEQKQNNERFKKEIEDSSSNLASLLIQIEDSPKIDKIDSSTIKEESKERRHFFKNSDDVFDAYFPNLEKQFPNEYIKKEFGETTRERYKRLLPISFLLRIKTLTQEQRQEYKRIRQLEKEDYDSFSQDKFVISDTDSDGFETMMAKRTIVKDYYIPQYMNLLTKEQQLELVKEIQKFFDDVEKSFKSAESKKKAK